MKSILAVVGVCAVLLVGGYFLLGVRGKVLKNKVVDQIDEMIGKADIQKAKIDQGIKGLDKAIEKLQEQRIRAEKRAENLTKEVKEGEDKLEEYKTTLSQLKVALTEAEKSSKAVTFANKERNKEDLDKLADQLIKAYELAKPDVESAQNRLKTVKSVADNLRDKEDTLAREKSGLERQIKEINAKVEEAKTMRDAAKLMGETEDKSMANNLEALKQDVKKLNEDTDVKRALEDEKWKKVTTKSELEKLDDVIKATTENGKTRINKIDEILGKPAGK